MNRRLDGPVSPDRAWAHEFLASIAFETDSRNPTLGSGSPRHLRFRQGWADAERQTYGDDTLRRLTWQNLGYRCALAYRDRIDVDQAFEALHALYEQEGPEPDRARRHPPTGAWSDAEAIAALVTWLDVRDGVISKTPGSPVWRLAQLTGRKLSAAYARMQDFKAVDPAHTGGLHATAQLVALWKAFVDPTTGDVDEAAVRAEYDRLWKDQWAATPAPPDDAGQSGIELGSYIRANEAIEPQPRSPAKYDEDVVGRGFRSHSRIQNALHDHLVAAGLKPGPPVTGDPKFDLGWWVGSRFFVAEVKSLTPTNEEHQLRLGLGQVLRYRHVFRSRAPEVVAVLAVESAPKDPTWVPLCDEVGVRLVWPDGWRGLLADGR